VLHPQVSGHLIRLLDPGASQHAPYVGNVRGQSFLSGGQLAKADCYPAPVSARP